MPPMGQEPLHQETADTMGFRNRALALSLEPTQHFTPPSNTHQINQEHSFKPGNTDTGTNHLPLDYNNNLNLTPQAINLTP